jgi:hypothetical protein
MIGLISFPRAAAAAMIQQAVLSSASYHYLPLLHLLCKGRMTLHTMQPGCTSFPLRRAPALPLPALVIISDGGVRGPGPSGFPAAAQVFEWAAATGFNAAGPHSQDYEAAGKLALRWCAAALVETTVTRLPEWHALAAAHQSPPGLPLGFTVLPQPISLHAETHH